jgi:hypothetical protein
VIKELRKMTAEFNWNEIEISEIIEGVTAIMVAPILLPMAAAMNQPLAKKTIKEAIAFSQRCQEAVADAKERIEDILAEAQAESEEEQVSVSDTQPPRPRHHTSVPLENSEVADEMLEAVRELNTQLEWISKGYVDLRLLMPLGLGILALGQLITQGPRLEEIPWYNLAWYAFDSFNKLNRLETEKQMIESDSEARK